MPALLKLIPLKDWSYIGCILALAVGFASYTMHERHVGAAVVQKKDAALAAAAIALNKASEQLADIKEIQIGHVYEKIIQLPPVADSPGLMCHNSAPAVEPATAGDRPETAGPPAPRTDDVFNPSGALRTDARNADGQINGLIDTVMVLEAELQGKTK